MAKDLRGIAQGIPLKTPARKENPESLYDFFVAIDHFDLLKYAILTMLVCYIVKQIRFNSSLLPGLAISSVLVYFLAMKSKTTENNRHADLMSKIERLQRTASVPLDYLYLEPEVVDFFANEHEFRSFAADSFDKCLTECNSILQLKFGVEQGVPRCSADIDTGHDLRITCLNAFSEIAYNLPGNEQLHDKLWMAVQELHRILLRLLEEMKEDCLSVQQEIVLDDNTVAPFPRSASESPFNASILY